MGKMYANILAKKLNINVGDFQTIQIDKNGKIKRRNVDINNSPVLNLNFEGIKMGKHKMQRFVNQSVDFKKSTNNSRKLSPLNKFIRNGRAFDDVYVEPSIKYEFEKRNLVRETFSPNF